MSILAQPAQVTPTTAPTVPENQLPAALFTIALGLVVAFGIAWALGVFRAGSIRGPVRLGRRVSMGRFIAITAIGAFLWFATQVLYIGHAARGDPETLTAADFAIVATVPFVIGVIALIFGDVGARQHLPRRLGYAAVLVPGAVLRAIVAMFAVMPLMLAASLILQLVYQAMNYQHPTEHRLLKVMTDAPVYLRATLVIGATVFAPLFEEIFFRGHVQTILVRLFSRTRRRDRAFPKYSLPGGPAGRAVLDYATPALDYATPAQAPPRRPGGAARWAAVVVTSVIFAVIHEPWTAPIIFLLSLCLGYAYERTGNLWVPIFMHAIFNGAQTAFFLLAR